MAVRLKREDAAMIERSHSATTPRSATAPAQFGPVHGERWRRFLERVGTRSNDFGARLSRARFVYLHRRETATNWLPL
jgi:hypothetical protein